MHQPYMLRAWHKRERRMYQNIGIIPQEFEVRLGLHHVCDFDDVEIMRWTGLLDRNDIPIYEGDILFLENYVTPDFESPEEKIPWGYVIFENASFKVARMVGALTMHSLLGERGSNAPLEVIGNIYEDRHLLIM